MSLLPAQRAGLEEIKRHPWVWEGMPPGALGIAGRPGLLVPAMLRAMLGDGCCFLGSLSARQTCAELGLCVQATVPSCQSW